MSWGAEGAANEITPRLWLFFRCFTKKTARVANAALPLATGFSAQIDGIRISAKDIIRRTSLSIRQMLIYQKLTEPEETI